MNEKLVIATAIALPIVYGITKVTKTLACAKAYAQVVARMDTLRDLDKKNGIDCLNTTRSICLFLGEGNHLASTLKEGKYVSVDEWCRVVDNFIAVVNK